ncbi:hypothetical protein [Pedobacter psychrodurus]|uniref:hypothetical protein n=1 Tax=Pedobacter psychrodurus TaxID=2530456 RepID=UPI00292F6AC9|nr:hypothetical protein [Pedobacter psychrodurus]
MSALRTGWYIFPWKIVAALLVTFVSSSAVAQKDSPVSPKIINLSVTADGRITVPPERFSLIEDQLYQLKINVEPSEKSHNELITFFRDRLKAHSERINDPTDEACKAYQLLFGTKGDFESYKTEVADLLTIFKEEKTADIKQKLSERATTDFPHFHGRVFLVEQFFGDIHTVRVNSDGNSKTVSTGFDKPVSVEMEVQKFKVHQINLDVRVSDMKKNFIARYFAKSRENIKGILDTLKVKSFYTVSVDREIRQLNEWRKNALEQLNAIDIDNVSELCSTGGVNGYNTFKSGYERNPLIKLLRANWLVYWGWYTDSQIKLNPLDFTDPGLLPLKEGFDTLQANNFDIYVKNSISRSLDLHSELPISTTKFDSLNRQMETGKERYKFTDVNEKTKALNAKNMASAQAIRVGIDSLTFRVLDKNSVRTNFIRVYDASGNLMPSKETETEAIPIKTHVEAMAYNLKAKQVFSLTPTFVDISGKSSANEQLDDAVGMTSVLGALGGEAAISLGLVQKTFAGVSGTPKVTIKAPVSVDPLARHDNTEKAKSVVFILKVEYSHGGISLFQMDEEKNIEEETDLGGPVDQALKKVRIVECKELTDAIYAEIRKKFPPMERSYSTTADKFDKIRKRYIDGFTTGVEAIILAQVQLKARLMFEDIRDNYSALTLAELVLAEKSFVIPPKEIKVQDDPQPALYYNRFIPIADQTSPKEISLTLYAVTKKDTIKRTDTYKVSRPQYITGSLGLAYITKKFRRSDVTVANGVISNAADEEQARVIAGLHVHIFPILQTNDKFISRLKGEELLSRFSVFVGVSFPKPLYNPHLGLTVEPWPSIRITGGAHFYRRTSHTIINDQIADEQSKYVYNAPFLALTIEPATFVKLIGSLIK